LVLLACVLVVSFISVTTLLAQQTITETVTNKEKDIIIKTDKGDYTATGGDIDKFVGKKVKATGDVDKMTIKVKKVEEVK
jgi:hypothetical protein